MSGGARLVVAAALLLAGSAGPASAQYGIEDMAAQDGKGLFKDANTGFVWMDLNTFYNLSYADQVAQLLPGFQVATLAQVSDLTNISMPMPVSSAVWTDYETIVGGSPSRELIWGSYETGSGYEWYYAFSTDATWSRGGSGAPHSDHGLWAVNTSYSGTNTVTPEPISMMLLGTGLAGIAAARRRKRPAEEIA